MAARAIPASDSGAPSRFDNRSDRLCRPTDSLQGPSTAHLRPTWSPELVRKGLRGAILIDQRSILARPGDHFSDFSVVFWSGGSTRSKMRRHAKNLEKTLVFTGFWRIRSCAREAKIDRKSFRTHFSTESHDGSPSKITFSQLRALNMVLRGLSGASWGALERLLRRSWALLGRSWELVGLSWPLLGRFWDAFGRSLAALGKLLGRSGRFSKKTET